MKRLKLDLWLVALVTIGPVVAAYVLYYGGEPRRLPRLVNTERALLDPAVPLPAVAGRSGEGAVDDVFGGPRWALIYARSSPCDETCLEELIRLRQVHLALGRDQSRVQRVYVGPGDASLVARDPAVVIATLSGDAAAPAERGEVAISAERGAPSAAQLVELLDEIGLPPGPEGRVYVADPHGNLVLSYPPDPDQEGLRDDLERLLRVSRIG